jgi:hypothetical protein
MLPWAPAVLPCLAASALWQVKLFPKPSPARGRVVDHRGSVAIVLKACRAEERLPSPALPCPALPCPAGRPGSQACCYRVLSVH